MMTYKSEFTVLLACVRYYLGTTTLSEVSCLLTSDINWTTLLETAISNGVMPLLYQSLRAIDDGIVPRAVMVQLQTLNRMNGLHNFSQTKELLKVLLQLEKASIDAIAFKGPVLAASVYGNVTLRQFNDLDILVKQEDFWQAKAVLGALDYKFGGSEADEIHGFNRYFQISLCHSSPETTMFNQQFESSLLHSNPETSIDLHWGIPPRRIWKSDPFKRLWENLHLINLMGQPIKIFSPETTLTIQCINFAKEPWKRSFKQICDVGQIIQANPDLNWQSALELSSSLRSQRLFLIGLSVTHQLLHVPLPQFVLEMVVKSQPKKARIFERDSLLFWLPESSPRGKLQDWWWEYTDQLKTLDKSWHGLFITAHYLQLILTIVFEPNERDRKFLPLPSRLFFLYYVIRPIRMLIKFSLGRKSFVMANKF